MILWNRQGADIRASAWGKGKRHRWSSNIHFEIVGIFELESEFISGLIVS